VRVRAAKAPQAEEARAQAQLARVQLEEEHAEHQLASARQRLAALWGSTEPDFGEARGDLLTLPALTTFDSLRAKLENNSDVARLVSEKRLRETEQRLAEMRRRPPWQVTAGVRRFEVGDDHAFVVGLTVPIASRDAAQGAVIEARAQSAQVDARAAALRVQLDAELFGIYQELRHAYAEVNTLRSEVLPRVEAAAEQSRYAYERGRYGYIEWVAAQRELVELRRALLDASADVHRQRIEIERLTGTSLDGAFLP
jgi:cobalt-zinc-cadmium efflux system outer membrane protein